MKTVAVIGGGLMGSGIAQVIAEAGKKVCLVEVDSGRVHNSLEIISNNLSKKVKKGKCTKEYMDETLARISGTTDMEEIREAPFIIEAVPENLDLKKQVFRQIEVHAAKDAIIASNTSGLSIAAIGSATKRPEKVIGLHFFYPAPVMKLVEVIPSLLTDKQTYVTASQFVRDIKKEPVECKDYPGFLVNRILVPMINEAIFCLMEGVKPEDVDQAMKLGANHRMGPIALADFVGLDVLLATMEGLYEGFSDSKYRPAPLLKKMVESGNLGRKTGRGFYVYDEEGKPVESSL